MIFRHALNNRAFSKEGINYSFRTAGVWFSRAAEFLERSHQFLIKALSHLLHWNYKILRQDPSLCLFAHVCVALIPSSRAFVG